MTCYSPLKGFRGPFNKNGKQPLVFSRGSARNRVPVSMLIPCGQCIGCRLKYSRCWAIRCIHEAQLNTRNCFITLTYDKEHLPSDRGLRLEDFQLFMKRLRKRFPRPKKVKGQVQPKGISYFHSGEYGENFGRPHYHAILFNFDFLDRVFLKNTSSGFPIYTSELLSKLWGKGYVSVADVSFSSAAYIARYVLKKVTGKDSEEFYRTFDSVTGEIVVLRKEYGTMSRNPALGKEWLEQYMSSVYPRDSVVVKTPKGYKEFGPPRYYDNLYEEKFGSEAFLELKKDRLRKAKMSFNRRKKIGDDKYYESLVNEEICKMRDVERLLRSLENDNV